MLARVESWNHKTVKMYWKWLRRQAQGMESVYGEMHAEANHPAVVGCDVQICNKV